MVASSQVWWLLTGAPQGSEKLRQGSRVRCGHWGGCRIPAPGPRQATQALEALPGSTPPCPCPAVGRGAARQAADRATLSAWTTQPPATLLLGLLFSFGGARADPGCCRAGRWGQCVLATSCSFTVRRLDLEQELPQGNKAVECGAR